MDERSIEKLHFVVKDIQEDFRTNWCGKLIEADPVLKDGKPIFVIIGSEHRLELNTIDLNYVEKCAKRMTHPKGRQAYTFDSARIYIKETSGNEMLIGVVSHSRTKTFAPVYGKRKQKEKI